ncbi:MAG: hypothetical protein HQK65_22980 [Desulfamplus sp.]|nr:hypothetical protein [Desulfamplus sp.]
MSVMKQSNKGQLPLFSLENIFDAYLKCRRRKRNTINALKFEASFLDNIITLQDELISGTYHPSTSICFVQKKPKLREIFAADFRDRVVHHLLVNRLEPKFEGMFIHDSYSCRQNKGVHAAVARLKFFLDKVTDGGKRPAWYLKEDIRGFFMNMDQQILHGMICRHFKDQDVRELARKIIFSRCIDDYRFKGNQAILDKIPPHKTLFKVGDGKGLPIGNLTSQFFANVYLNELDQFVKHDLKCRFYIRYCDDFVLLSHTPAQLSLWHDRIDSFLRDRLELELNPSQLRLRPVSSGIDFLGYVIRRRYKLVRRRVVNNFKARLDFFDEQLSRRDDENRPVQWHYPPAVLESFRSTAASYLGHFKWANSFSLMRKLLADYPVLRACFILKGHRLIPRYIPPGGRRRLRRSYNWWFPDPDIKRPPEQRPHFPLWVYGKKSKVLIFFQVGCFYEFFNAQAEIAHDILKLKKVKGLHRFRVGCGFPTRSLSFHKYIALKNGFHVALIQEFKRVDGSVSRHLTAFYRADNPIKVLEFKSKPMLQMEFDF